MSYPIWIAVDSQGTPYIGAQNIADAEKRGAEIVDREQVYGSQIPHRVVGCVGGLFSLLTPTLAARLGAEHVCSITGYQCVQAEVEVAS